MAPISPSPEMAESIQAALRAAEAQGPGRILYACESGSRAWGFASPDSDWDVRYIYSMPIEWYLSVLDQPDYFSQDFPLSIDLSGWELRKALRLFGSCNLPLNEWLGSAMIYRDSENLRDTLRSLIPAFFNPKKAIHHYRSIAQNSMEYLDPSGQIAIKKLFYILRPLLAATWIYRTQSMPPTSFHEMRKTGLMPEPVEEEIDGLVLRKQTAIEGEKVAIPGTLDSWIQSTLVDLPACADAVAGSPEVRPYEALDRILRTASLPVPPA
jgi:predicted nucleotidyltransferase